MTLRREHSKNIFLGIFLIGLGLLFVLDWWWPGIMLVVGLALAAETASKGRYRDAGRIFLIFLAIPVVVAVLGHSFVPLGLLGPMLLIAVGVFALIRAVVR